MSVLSLQLVTCCCVHSVAEKQQHLVELRAGVLLLSPCLYHHHPLSPSLYTAITDKLEVYVVIVGDCGITLITRVNKSKRKNTRAQH